MNQLELDVDDDLAFSYDEPLILDTASEDSRFTNAPACSMFVENYPGAAEIIKTGPNMYAQLLEADSEHSEGREIVGPWYPFAGRAEWELAKWLNSAHLSMNKVDEFLRLDYVSSITLMTTLKLLERTVIVLGAKTGPFIRFVQGIKTAHRPTSRYSSLETGSGRSMWREHFPTIKFFLPARS